VQIRLSQDEFFVVGIVGQDDRLKGIYFDLLERIITSGLRWIIIAT
jgi:hypothetical protein